MNIETAKEARAHILQAVDYAGLDEVLAAITEWNNTTENEITEAGDIWVSNPQSGHWLSEDHLIEFAEFLK
jgi:hypothetical protein